MASKIDSFLLIAQPCQKTYRAATAVWCNDERERWEPAADDARIGADLNRWLPSAPRFGRPWRWLCRLSYYRRPPPLTKAPTPAPIAPPRRQTKSHSNKMNKIRPGL